MHHVPAIFAFGILNLPMLGWLAAAAAPILIHLWSRRKYREMSWAAMEYLLAAMRQRARRVRLEQWLLLAVRTSLVVLLVLAVARPYLQQSGLAFVGGGQTHRVLVIDGSYSMAYRPTDKSRFDRAKELAARIVEESPQGDAFTLVVMASPPRVVVGTPALERAAVLQEIENLPLVHTAADLPATVAVLEQLLDNAAREDPRLGRHEIYFLTDLGRVGWLPRLSEWARADFRRRSEALAAAATLVVIDVGQEGAENTAVTGLRTLEPVATLQQAIHFEAELKNFGRQPRKHQPVDLLVDGRRVAQQFVDLAAGGESAASLRYIFETPGDHTVEVRTEGDALEVDNHRWMVVPVRQSVRVLCIDGRPSGEPFRGATDYLARALAPTGDRPRQIAVQVETAPESALLEQDLGRYDCVFLCDVAQFTASEARVLDAYLGAGGNLVFFLGHAVLADRYNRQLGAGPGRLLPAELGRVVTEPQTRLDPLGYRHPLVEAFRGRGQAGLLTTPVEKHFQLTLPKKTRARVALALGNGDPLVVEESIRRGRVILVATSADATWTPMPLWPSYVPLVQEMLAWCVHGGEQQRNLDVGQPLEGSIAAPPDTPLSVQGPDGRSRAVRLRANGDYSEFRYGETFSSGIYTARFGPPVSRTQTYAVNVDTAESDLARIDVDQLRDEVWPGVPFLHQTSWSDLDRPAGGSIAPSSRLDVGLLYAVLGLLLVETLLAWRFGHHA